MGYDDHMDYAERRGLEQALDEVYSAIPDHVREKHGTLAEAVAAMAAWPDKAIKALTDLQESWDLPNDDYDQGGNDALYDAVEAVRNVE